MLNKPKTYRQGGQCWQKSTERNADRRLKGIVVTGVPPRNRRKVFHFNKDPFILKGFVLNTFTANDFNTLQITLYQLIMIETSRL
ncbi:hypothetical protein A4D02_00180 [Niastella koreensis]|uniref:Uncharacterized protein n=1 Tax=Niastella koreensis TaxID=354356 RepID=A0ABX3P475_9BACT|nr:hypothetical protein A4D02_00180 [Niastella koreensis]